MKDGQVPFDQLVRVEKAHDVRTLRRCTHCSQFGNSDWMIDHGASWYHGRCFAQALGRRAFMALPLDKTRRLMLGDVGAELATELLNRR